MIFSGVLHKKCSGSPCGPLASEYNYLGLIILAIQELKLCQTCKKNQIQEMERYINISPTVFTGADLEGAIKKKRSRVERSPSALSDGGAMAARAQTDLSDSSVNNQAADASKKGIDIFRRMLKQPLLRDHS